MKVLAVDMSDGTTWAFPASLVVENRRRAYEEMGRVVADPDDDVIEDWASNNMNWCDVEAFAKQIARHVAAILADHRRIVGELRAEMQAAHESLAVVAADAQATQTQLSAEKTTTAVLRKAVRELRAALTTQVCMLCSNKGTYETACSFCGDSTYDHHCDSVVVDCDVATCVTRRSALTGTAGLVACPRCAKPNPEDVHTCNEVPR